MTPDLTPDLDELLLHPRFIKQRGYWSKKLTPGMEITELLPPTKEFCGDPGALQHMEIVPGETCCGRLMKFSKGAELSMYIVLLTVLKVLIYRWGGKGDVTVLSPVYSPAVSEMTLNRRLYIRDELSAEIPFIQLLLRVRQSVLEAFEHQDYPSQKLWEHLRGLQTAAPASPAPGITRVLCLMEKVHDTGLLREEQDKLSFSFVKKDERVQGRLWYPAGIYQQAHLDKIPHYFTRILEHALSHLETGISKIPLLGEEERRCLVFTVNTTQAEVPGEPLIHREIHQQVLRTPDNIAVVDQATGTGQHVSVSFRELSRQADRLARQLRARGLRAGGIAALAMEPSLEMVTTLWAVLKTGAAYLPLDRDYPRERTRFLLKDTQPKILLPGDLPGEEPGPATLETGKEPTAATALAYIVYTSGSTGRPKGVMVNHRSLVNYIQWARKVYLTGQVCYIPLYSSLAFDLTVTSIYLPLVAGKTLITYRDSGEEPVIAKIFRHNRVDLVKLTPSHLKLIKELELPYSRISRLIVGGEQLTTALASEIYRKFLSWGREVEIFNEYGPTETTVGCMIHRFQPDKDRGPSVPIGRPAANVRIYLLDARGNLLPQGAAGEIYIAGAGVARGYVNNPGLTAERFCLRRPGGSFEKPPPGPPQNFLLFSSPITHHPSPLYKTGDLARWLPEGELEFLGRVDLQVKIRGYRIEPAEIQRHLETMAGVKETVVVPREEGGGEYYLCAYVVPAGKEMALDLPHLRQSLENQLPAYMIPAHFLCLEKIPLTPNGKLDTRALPLPRTHDGAPAATPRTSLEKKLARVWSEVLKIEKENIGIDDSFFDHGGHSLKAQILIARIHKEFNVNVPLSELFNASTLRELARFIKGTGTGPGYTPIEPVEEREFYPLSSAQKRLYALQQMDLASTVYNIPIMLRLEGPLDRQKLESVFMQLLERHEVLRTFFIEVNEEPVQRVRSPRDTGFRLAYLETGQPQGKTTREIIAGFIRPFTLSGLLLRVGLLKQEQELYILLVDLHHIISDLVSMEIFVREMAAFYREEKLPPLKIRYRDYCQWQRQEKRTAAFQQVESYWLRKFPGKVPLLQLPLDYDRPAVRSFEGKRLDFEIEERQTGLLKALAREETATVYQVMLSVFYLFLSRLSGQEEIVVGTTVTGRPHNDLQQTIGMFVNTLALRVVLDRELPFRGFLRRLKQQTLEAFENQDYPLEDLVEAVAAKRETGRNPLFDVVFAFQTDEISALAIPGLTIKPHGYTHNTAKFDLGLYGSETDRGLRFTFEYSTRLFKEETIKRLAGYFQNLVSSVLQDPDRQSRALAVPTPGEEETRESKKNGSPEEILVHSRFIRQRGYWMEKLSPEIAATGFLPVLHLSPPSPPFPPDLSRAEISFPAAGCQLLLKLGQRSDLSIYIILLTLVKLLIARYTGSEAVTVQIPVYPPGVSNTTFNRYLFIRDEIPGHVTFLQLLLQVRGSVLQAFENQDYPLEKVLEQVNPTAAAGGKNRLSPVLCTFTPIHGHDEPLTRESQDLVIFRFDRENLEQDRVRGDIYYNPQVWDTRYLEKLPGYFSRLFAKALENPRDKVWEIPWLPEQERKQWLFTWNATQADYPAEKPLQHWLLEEMRRCPDTMAVVDREARKQWPTSISFRELNRQAASLARRLRTHGVRPGALVALAMEPSVEMMAGLLGVLQAGAAYLPIDRAYPRERIQHLLEDSKTRVILSTGFREDTAFPQHDCLEIKLPAAASEPPFGQSGQVTGTGEEFNSRAKLAYVMYTSGSTGKPKGAAVEHQSLVNYVQWARKVYLTENIRYFPLYSSLAFDLTVTSIYLPLVSGKTIVTYRETGEEPVISRVFRQDRVDLVKLTPSHLKIIKELELHRSRVSRLIVGGEQLSTALAAEIYRKFLSWGQEVEIFNEYGPTETVVGCMIYRYNHEKDRGTAVPLGQPADNVQIYLLDRQGNPLPPGGTGEIYISGAGVARGYLNQPELSADKFLRNPFVSGQRMYKSGDLARRLPTGDLEFRGRADQQVKIRGYRIEPLEIESRLLQHRDIKEAVVIPLAITADLATVDNVEAETSLCAYIAPLQATTSFDIPGLKEFLLERLPAYMVPAHFVPLARVPLTPNGKVDIKALPLPAFTTGKTSVPPRNDLEKKLMEIWWGLLGRGRSASSISPSALGIDDNFFRLGGHSLKATQLVSRIHKACQVKMLLSDVFQRPTIREMAEYISQAPGSRYAIIPPASSRDYYVLSSAQKRLFILQRLQPESTGYNMPAAFLLEGGIEIGRLEQTFQQLTRRHESFRTSFHWLGDEPVQKIYPRVAFSLQFHNPGVSPRPIEPCPGVREIMAGFVEPFDLSSPPLLRVGVLRLAKERHILLVDMHHIVADAISLAIVVREFMAFRRGDSLPVLRLQYKDFSQWQDSERGKAAVDAQQEFWKRELQGDLPVPDLPGDWPRPAVRDFAGEALEFEMNEEETAGLKQVAAEGEFTLFMILLAVFNVFLAKLTRTEEIIVGTPAANRRHPDLESIVGMFVNTLALRNYPAGARSCRDFLNSLRETALRAFENQEYPFEELVEVLKVRRDIGRNPIFDVMFGMQNAEIPRLAIPGLTISPYEFPSKTVKFDLSLFASEEENRLKFTVQYRTRLFKTETIHRFTRYFKTIAAAVVKNPRQRLSAVELLTAEEKTEILSTFNDTQRDYPAHKTVIQLLEAQVERTPDAIALVDQSLGKRLTVQVGYQEVNRQAGGLARLLRARGCGPGTIAAIRLERSLEMIIGILGILKAGAAYLPIEPGYPEERASYLLAESGTALTLTRGDNKNDQRSDIASIFHLQKTPAAINPGEKQDFTGGEQAPGTRLTYVLYTSGSTGQPKGVMVEQGSVVNILWDLQQTYPLGENGAYLFKTSFLFDVSVTELLGWFFGGGRLIVPEPGTQQDPFKIVEVLQTHRVTHINFVPSMFAAFLEFLQQHGAHCLKQVKYIFLAGETLLPRWVEDFRRLDTNTALENLYGPTEGTIYASGFSLARWDGSSRVPIGKPLANVRLYIVDFYFQVLPIGITGLLRIAGAGIARGYLNNPELTAEYFCLRRPGDLFEKRFPGPSKNFLLERIGNRIEHMSYMSHMSCFYSTGDLARWLPGGEIEFLGRQDHQVKVRGYRVELGEIESRLLQHPRVQEAVVMARQDHQGEMDLCAYIVPRSPGQPGLTGPGSQEAGMDLRAFLSDRLPGYMIPRYIVNLERFPLTPGGKIDRGLLPAPGVQPGSTLIPPRTALEQQLAGLWSELLGMEPGKISLDMDFMGQGGNSLKAIALISRIYKYFHVKFPLLQLFKTPTLEAQARFIAGAVPGKYISIEPTEKKEYYPLSSGQRRMYGFQHLNRQSTAFNITFVRVVKGVLEKDRSEAVLEQLMQRHESLRTAFEEVGGQPVQRVYSPASKTVKIDYDETAAAVAVKTLTGDFAKPFDLSRAPLFRLGVIKAGSGSTRSQVLVIDMHHIITDGTSMQRFQQEFLTFYHGGAVQPLALQYKDYSHWQNHLGREEVRQQEDYWLRQFNGTPPPLDLPLDFARPELQDFAGETLTFTPGAETSQALKNLAAEQGCTLFMLLLTLDNVFLARLCQQYDIVVGAAVAGRRHPGLEPILGMFVNLLALRNYPQPGKTFSEFLSQVKQRTMEAFENQEYPFENLVEKVITQGKLSRNPLIETVFNLQNIDEGPGRRTSATALEFQVPTQYGPEHPTTKYDLLLHVLDGPRELEFTFEYRVRLFKPETVQLMKERFLALITSVLANPGCKLGNLDDRTSWEKQLTVISDNNVTFNF